MFGGKMMILKFLHCQCLGVNLQHQKVMKKCQQVIKKRQKVIKNARIAHQIIGMQLIQKDHFPNHHLFLKKENFVQVCILSYYKAKAELLQEVIFFLIHLFARDVLLMKKLEIEKQSPLL